MKLKIHWLALLLLLFSFFTVQFSEAVSQSSQTMTNYGSIVFLDPATDIFFEYGAESGVLKPPWDFAGLMGDGDRDYSEVTVSSEQARTGTKSMKFYQESPIKSDAERRVRCREWTDVSFPEMYLSYWVYLPDNMKYDAGGWSGQWSNLGGIGMRCGPTSWKHKYSQGFSLYLNDGNPRRFYFKETEPYGEYTGEEHIYNSDYYLNNTYANTWIHVQIYVKYSNSSNGIWTGRINNDLVKNVTGRINDPRGYSRWNDENLVFAYPNGVHGTVQLYQRTTSPEAWCYADDVVFTDTKVSESYGVG